MDNAHDARYIVRYSDDLVIECRTTDDAIALLDAIRFKRSIHGHPNAARKNPANGTRRRTARSSFESGGGSSEKLLSHLLTVGKAVPESEIMSLFGFDERRQLAGVRTGLRTALKHANIDPDRALIRAEDDQGNVYYSIHARYAGKIKSLLKTK